MLFNIFPGGRMNAERSNRLFRWYWALPPSILLYAYLGNANTPGFAWWAFLAAVACGLPLLATGYDPLSFVTVLALLHVLYYPFAVILNLMASRPGVYEGYLWENTPAAMLAVSVGMVGFALGSKLAALQLFRFSHNKDVADIEAEVFAVSPNKITLLVCLIIPLALFQMVTNTYYQSLATGSDEWSYENAISYGYVGYIEYIVCAAAFLQLRRYFISKTRKDFVYATIAVLLPLVVYLPSGSRDRALRITVYAFILSLIGFKKGFSKKVVAIIGLSLFGIFLFMGAVETYRGMIHKELGRPTLTFIERIQVLSEASGRSVEKLRNDFDYGLRLWGRRFSDYVVPGRIVSVFPSMFGYRYFEDMEYWPAFLLPNPIRPATPGFNPQDGAALSASVGIYSGGGSSPCMMIGDLYSRFSWPGIFLGMALLGYVFRSLDQRLSGFGIRQSLLFGLLLIPILKMPQESLFGVFLLLSRNLLISLGILIMLEWFLLKSNRRLRHFNRSTSRGLEASVSNYPPSRAR